MARNLLRNLKDKTKFYSRRQKWNKVVTAMAGVVVFCTTYALILPAITLENPPLCGMEEHQHTEACYDIPQELSCAPGDEDVIILHTHNEFCYDAENNLICTLTENKGHRHGDGCYAPAESEDGTTHEHTEDCYKQVPSDTPSCGQEEGEGHAHTDACLKRELVCGLEENHVHSASCYSLICDIPEGHTHGSDCFLENKICEDAHVGHTDDCYGEPAIECEEDHEHTDACLGEAPLICEDAHVQHTVDCYGDPIPNCDIPEGHVHDLGTCYDTSAPICGQVEGHVHGDECYAPGTEYGCGLEESDGHHHTDDCYELVTVKICGYEDEPAAQEEEAAERKLICGQEELYPHLHSDECYNEEGELICPLPQVIVHNHTAECLTPVPGAEAVPVCGLEEHTHTDECRIDKTADVETPDMWEATLPEITTDDWSEALLTMARSQIGYQESTRNYVVDEITGQVKGYTRYGQWAGNPYEDWCDYFIAFCRHYAGIPAEAFPQHPGQPQWCDALKEENWGIYLPVSEYTPGPGDTIYFDLDCNGALDHVGIVEELIPETEEEPAKLQTIEGNSSNRVQRVKYLLDAPEILGYASIANARERWELLHPEDFPKTYYCGLEEHEHTDECVDPETGEYICGLEVHTHTPACEIEPKTYYCGLTEHEHTAECVDPETGEYICGMEAHTHTEECEIEPKTYYCGLTEHEHTDECVDPETGEYICGLEAHTHTEECEVEPKTYYCGLEEHEHTDECVDLETGEYICGLEVHTHTAECEIEPKTYYCGLEEHEHTDDCVDPETGEYICGLEVHTHTPACEVVPKTYICGLTEHSHSESCADPETGETVCGLPEHTHTIECEKVFYCGFIQHEHTEACVDPETGEMICTLEAHVHTPACEVRYYCGFEEHTHGDGCYDEAGELICTIPAHTHTEECKIEPIYYCGKEPHSHGPDCYDPEGNLICTLEEHIHDAACLEEPKYYCGLSQHTHGEDCATCTLPEHTHDAECLLEFLCGLPEHTHGPDCSDLEGNLICTVTPHSHTDVCRLKKQSIVADTGIQILTEDTPTVTVEGYLPRGAKVTAVPVEVEGMLAAYDITVYDSLGNVFQPLPGEPVQVKFYIPGVTDDPDQEFEICNIPVETTAEEPPVEDSTAEEPDDAPTAGLLAAAPAAYGIAPCSADLIVEDIPENDIPAAAPPAPTSGEPIPRDTTVDGTGAVTASAQKLGREALRSNVVNPLPCDPDSCPLSDWDTWVHCSGTFPFGGAQGFNLFVFENIENWGDTHGNVAIGGNILGTSNSLSYDEGSTFDYAADITKANEIGLILGGTQNATSGDTAKRITVSNGSLIIQASEASEKDTAEYTQKFDYVTDDKDHWHVVTKQQLDDYFAAARGNKNDDTTLLGHNKTTFDYGYNMQTGATENDGHLGFVQPYDPVMHPDVTTDKNGQSTGATVGQDFVLKGYNSFYNVFNITSGQYDHAGGTTVRNFFLDVPYDSYTIINIVQPDGSTVVTDFTMQLWYRDSDQSWIKQPAKHGLANYDQTQMTMINFDPDITELHFKGAENYIYASMMGPDVDVIVDAGAKVDLHGTIVLESLKCIDDANPSSTIVNPFFAGASLELYKETVCDSEGISHAGHNMATGDTSCHICVANGKEQSQVNTDNFGEYYVDVQFQLMSAIGTTGEFSVKKGIPMDGVNSGVVNGMAPGRYRVEKEVVYKLINGKKVTVDDEGYCMLVEYLEEDGTPSHYIQNWTLSYCNEDLEPIVNFDSSSKNHRYTYPLDSDTKDSLKISNAPTRRIFQSPTQSLVYGHSWVRGAFKKGGVENAVIEVKPGQDYTNYTLVNHYNIEPKTTRTVLKIWQDANGNVIPGPDVTINVTLKMTDAPVTVPTNEGTVVGTKALNSSNGWQATWDNLELGKFYFIEEDGSVPGLDVQLPTYDQSKGGWNNLYNDKLLMFYLVNKQGTPVPKSITVTKRWYNDDGTVLKDTTGKQAEMTIYRQTGTMLPKPTSEAQSSSAGYAKGLTSMLLYANKVEGSHQDSDPYYGGSDATVTVTYFVKHPEKMFSEGFWNGADQYRLKYNGKTLEAEPQLIWTAHNNVDGELLPYRGYYAKFAISVNIPNLPNKANGSVDLVLAQTTTGDDFCTLISGLTDPYTVCTDVKVNNPSLTITETRIADQWITWHEPLVEEGQKLPAKTEGVYSTNENINSIVLNDTFTLTNGQAVVTLTGGAEGGNDTAAKPWEYTWNELSEVNANDSNIRYRYYVLETDRPEGYTPKHTYFDSAQTFGEATMDNVLTTKSDQGPFVQGVNSGHVLVQNKPVVGGPELPMTGSVGTAPYTFGGLLSACLAGVLLQYNHKKRRKEDSSP